MKTEFIIDNLNNYQSHNTREWLLTNGIGGYAGSTVINSHCRNHQGYLIASLHAPVERYLCFSKTEERLISGSRIYDISCNQHKKDGRTQIRQGNVHQKRFKYDGTVEFIYDAGGLRLTKTIALVYGQNRVVISYLLENNGPAAGVVITPLVNFRDHGAHHSKDSLLKELPPKAFSDITDKENNNCGFCYSPVSRPDVRVSMQFCGGSMQPRTSHVDEDMELVFEQLNEEEGTDCHMKPYDFVLQVPAGGVAKASLVCTVDIRKKGQRTFKKISPITEETSFEAVETARDRAQTLVDKAGYSDELACALTLAADAFIVKRASTGLSTLMAGYPWFADWGRDTMIAFTGLTLDTKRFDDAREILLSFAKYIKDGLIPNCFPDDGSQPMYNTADASLWYFYAVYNYLQYVDTPEAWAFVEKDIYPALMQIMGAYRKGTINSIGMDDDALMRAGSDKDQVTWMDVRVGDWVATPRHGKPVEINALWYNALMTMEYISRGIAKRSHNRPEDYLAYAGGCATLATWAKESFNEQFWYEEGGYLYDVIDGENKDTSLRPNQIYAISLPFTMLDDTKAMRVFEAVTDHLYVGLGLRSLSPDHVDYQGIYQGSLKKRDSAYHQGTAWAFLLGAYMESCLKLGGYSAKAKRQVLAMMEPIKKHLFEHCVGFISEIFDGDAPHSPRGCYAQAWSVGEVLRGYLLYLRSVDEDQ